MEGSILIDTKEKLRHCMSVEKKIYFPEGGGIVPVWDSRKRCAIPICV